MMTGIFFLENRSPLIHLLFKFFIVWLVGWVDKTGQNTNSWQYLAPSILCYLGAAFQSVAGFHSALRCFYYDYVFVQKVTSQYA